MGNCLVMEKKVIKIVRNGGKVLEFRKPICVHHILTQFSGHSLFDNNNTCHLLPDAKLLSGRLYYLFPTTMNKRNTKEVTFADPEVEEEEEEKLPSEDEHHDDDTGESKNNREDNKSVSVVRMKIVVHKQELEKMLQGGSVHEMMYQTLEKQVLHTDDDDNIECNGAWRPMLDSIPEYEYYSEEYNR